MSSTLKHRIVALCDLLTPLAFVAAAASMLLPFASLHFAGEAPVELTGLHLIYATAKSISAAHGDLVQKLLNVWRPTIIVSALFALAGVVAVFVRYFGRQGHQKLFEKIELASAPWAPSAWA